MRLTPATVLEVVTVLGTVASLSFYLLALCGLISYLNQRRREARIPAGSLAPVSILKPLKGADPEQWEGFRSHCELDYPDYEIVFGVSDPNDPACDVVRKLQARYPARAIKLVVCDRILGANVKVSNLAQMLTAARHEVLLVNDSDIRVAPDYLRKVVAPLSNADVGLVTCLYRGTAASTLGSRLEALMISTDFAPGVLSARLIERGLSFGLGSTLAFRRAELQAIGGYESILDYLGDDYELGHRISALGKRVELSSAVVTTFLPAYTLGQFWAHQLRWMRTVRDARRAGYFGLALTFGLPWAIFMLAMVGGAAWVWSLVALTAIARVAVALGVGLAALDDRPLLENIWLLPIRDLLAPLIWAVGLVGNRIHWRGEDFYLKGGRLTRIGARSL